MGSHTNPKSNILGSVFTGGYYQAAPNSRQQNVSQNNRQDLYKASTQQREEIRELMGQIDMPDDSLTMSSLSQSPWNPKGRQRMSQTHGTNDASNSNDNENTLGRSEIMLDQTSYIEENKSRINRKQYNNGDDVSDSQNNQTHQDYDDSQMISQLDQDQSQMSSDMEHSRLQNFKRKIPRDVSQDDQSHLEESLVAGRGRDSPDFNRQGRPGADSVEDLDESHNGVDDDLTISHTVISQKTNTTSYRAPNNAIVMSETQNTRRVQNRTFADSVMDHKNNQLTSSSNNNTYRNNYSSNQDTHRNNIKSSRILGGNNKNKSANNIQSKSSRINRHRQDITSDDNRSDLDDEESESEDINRRIQEQSEDDDDEDYSPAPTDNRNRDRSRSNNYQYQSRRQQHQDEDHTNLDSSEFSDMNSFTKTQHSQMFKSKLMFKNVKGDDLEYTEDEHGASIIGKSPIVPRLKNMAHEESLSLTPVSNWNTNNRSMIGHSKTNRTNDNKIATNLNQVLLNNQNLSTLNMTSEIQNNRINPLYNATQVLFGQNNKININHNASIQRDQELEQAMEESSQNQTLNKTTLSNSGGPDPPLRQSQQLNQLDFRKTKYENIQLQVELKKAQSNVQDLAEQLRLSDLQKHQLEDLLTDFESKNIDLNEYVMLLKQKLDDESELPKLRSKFLQQARIEIQQLTQAVKQKGNQVQQLEKKIIQQEREDSTHLQIYDEQIKKTVKELERYQLMNQTLKRDLKNSQEDITKAKSLQHQIRQDTQKDQQKLKQEYDQWLQQMQQEYEQKMLGQKQMMQELEKKVKQLDKQLKQKDLQLEENESCIDQKDQIIQQIEREHEKMAVELGNFKERCKDLETELEHIRGGRDESYLANQSKINTTALNNTRANSYDFEVKKVKDMFTQQLHKAKEESQKYRSQVKDLEARCKGLEDENSKRYQQSITQTSKQIEKDQKMINDLQKANQKLNQFIQLDADIRDMFNFTQTDDIYQRLVKVSEDLEVKQLLESELEKLQIQLKDAQQREYDLIENQNKLLQSQQKPQKSSETMSNFTKTLLMNKEKEIENLKQQYERERQLKENLDDQLWKLQNQQKELQLTNQDLEVSIQELQRDLIKVKESKTISDKNVDELKEKLRVMIREQQEQSVILKQSQPQKRDQTYLDDVERKKYDELINMILELDLAQDPLAQVNLSLQESFIDEFEQAQKHLNEQKRLVQVKFETFEKEISNKCDTIKSLQDDIKTQLNTVTEQKKDMFRQQDQIMQKERELEVIQVEIEELHKSCERLSQQLLEVQDQNMRLRQDNEEVNLNFRKLMRAQDSLHKTTKNSNSDNTSTDKKSSSMNNKSLNNISQLFNTGNKTVKTSDNFAQEIERLSMVYEDQLSKQQRIIQSLNVQITNLRNTQPPNNVSQQDVSQLREQYREEVIDMLDQIIDNNNFKQLTFNDLGMKLAQRLDKVRQQERLKYSQGGNNNLLSSQISQNDNNNLQESQNQQQNNNKSISRIVQDFKQEINEVNNENELLSSINKWLKQSGNNNQQMQQQQNLFKNFFTNDDQNSLMLSELLVPNNNQPQKPTQNANINLEQIKLKEEQIQDLQSILEQKEKQLEVKTQEYEKLQQKLQQLQEDLKIKDLALKDSEDAYHVKFRELESDQKSRNQSMWKEVESLKEQIKIELQAKSEQLDLEYEELEKQKLKYKQQLLDQQKEQERLFHQKLESQEKEFRDKLRLIETDIKSGCEKSKEEQITNLCKQLEDQYQIRLKAQNDDLQQQMQLLKSEHNQKMEEAKRQKERESKKTKEEMDKLKKSNEDKMKKIDAEHTTEKECWDRDQKEKIDQIIQKHKKDIKTAQDKVRAEMRNQLDSVKNDMAKQKAEFEREKKKLLQEHENGLEQLKRDFEDQMQQELKSQQLKHEKLMKKKVDDKQLEGQKRIEEIENEIQLIRDSHSNELKKERDRIEMRVKEQVRADVRMEVHDELEIEFKEHLEKMKQQQQIEIDKIKTKYEVIMREERASMLPSQQQISQDQPRKVNAEVQCELLLENQQEINMVRSSINRPQTSQSNNQYTTNQYQTSYINTTSNNTSQISQQNRNNDINSQIVNNSLYVEQLKVNFEEELERQQQVFEVQLLNKQNSSVKVFEELMILEFDKILQSIYFKSSNNTNANQLDLDKKRNGINKLIADILNRNDDRKEKQMRFSLESLKKKISEVLKVFKSELESKLNKKQDQLIKEQVLKERLKIHNISEIVSSVSHRDQHDNLTSGRSHSQQHHNLSDIESESQHQVYDEFRSDYYNNDSRPTSLMPTPRNLDQIQLQQQPLNNSTDKDKNNQLSDIKKYSQEEEQNNNILKKVSPIVNSNNVLVVEVDKVVRDLKMLQQTIKIAKFYRILLNVDEQHQQESEKLQSLEGQDNNEATLQQYRVLLNDLFKIIAKMNQGIEVMCKQSEIYKLKLLNTELRDKVNKFEQEKNNANASQQVEEILNYFQNNINLLSDQPQRCLNILENTQFSINKLQLKLFSLIDLFTNDQSEIQTDLDSVENKCNQYLENNPNDQLQLQQLLQSTFTPEKNQYNQICPEMLSPEETAKLVANVFQRLNQTTQPGFSTNYLSQNNNINVQNHQLDSYQSFFNTFLSNDEYVKSAENFIQKYREQMNFTQKHQQNRRINRINTANINLPLQQTTDDIPLRYNQTQSGFNRQYQSVQINNINKQKRSRSQSNHGQNHNQSAFTAHPYYNIGGNQQLQQTNLMSNPSQTCVSNIFQKGCSENNNNMHSISIHTQNHSLLPTIQHPQNENINYMNIQQNNNSQYFGMHHSQSNNNILGSNFDTLSQGGHSQSNIHNTNMFSKTGQSAGVSQSFNGNPWRQTNQQQNQHQINQSSLSNPMLILNNQNQTINSNTQAGHISRSQQRMGSFTAAKSTDEVSQAQNSVNALFEKLKSNYQHTQSNQGATKNQSFN